MKWGEVGGRVCGSQPQILSGHPHSRENGYSVELHAPNAMFNSVLVIAAVHVRHSKPVIEKAKVESAPFQDFRYVLVEVDIGDIVSSFWVTPRCWNRRTVLGLEKTD